MKYGTFGHDINISYICVSSSVLWPLPAGLCIIQYTTHLPASQLGSGRKPMQDCVMRLWIKKKSKSVLRSCNCKCQKLRQTKVTTAFYARDPRSHSS